MTTGPDLAPATTSPGSPAEAYEAYYGPAIFGPLSEVTLATWQPPAGTSVLDVACGTGILTRRLAEAVGDGAPVVGVDLNPAMLEVARALAPPRDPPLRWLEGDGAALTLPDHAFDAVTCQQGLQFFPDRAGGVREMRRVLRPGGTATVVVWQGIDHHPLFAALADVEAPLLASYGLPTTVDEVLAPFSLGDEGGLTGLFEDAGFDDVEVTEASIVARFPDPDRFVARLEYAYAAVVPAFIEDPAAFEAYLEAVDAGTADVVARYRDGDHVAVPMHTRIVVAHA
ncbi:class I SAM-dependent methyltransferase [Nitriliruptor alkaliphilus]|uniref:class I SAM-dependent methyltransferase n=1 Tax=Nitriliruptor alkaliphilus TaxID=427918 RepID=UPI000AE8E189|nr:methyltransferase domain-containing protein [Nitriliruptor alkaliphilus]